MELVADIDKLLESHGVEITHHFSSGVYAKQTKIPAGIVLTQHKHNFDHLSILASGSVYVECEGESNIVNAPACLTIKAGAHHSVTALTDTVWFCIHATEETDPNKVDMELIHA